MVNCKKSPLRSSTLSWAGGVSLGHSYFDAQNSWIKSGSPLALILWGASYTWKNKGLFFLTAMDAPDIAKGSPTTLSSQWGSFLDSYSRPMWSATKTSRLPFIKIKQNDITFVMLLLLCVCCVLFPKWIFFSNFVPSLENQQPHSLHAWESWNKDDQNKI